MEPEGDAGRADSLLTVLRGMVSRGYQFVSPESEMDTRPLRRDPVTEAQLRAEDEDAEVDSRQPDEEPLPDEKDGDGAGAGELKHLEEEDMAMFGPGVRAMSTRNLDDQMLGGDEQGFEQYGAASLFSGFGEKKKMSKVKLRMMWRSVVRRVIQKFVVKRIKSMTALMHAVLDNKMELIKFLVEVCHAPIDVRDENGTTALMYGCRANLLGPVKYLHELHRADVNDVDFAGRSPLMYAGMGGAVDVARYLIFYAKPKANVNHKDNNGKNVLMQVAEKGMLDMVRWFVQIAKANPEARNKEGNTVLMIAAAAGKLNCVRWLADEGADIKAHNEDGVSAWRLALLNYKLGVFKFLFQQRGKEDINERDKFGFTALHRAAQLNDVRICRILVQDFHAELNETTQGGRTPLMEACIAGCLDAVKFLVEAGAKENLEDNDDRTAAMLATGASRWEVARWLEDRKHSDKEGEFPEWNMLMDQAEKEHKTVVQFALEKRRQSKTYDFFGTDRSGKTFLQHAALNGRLEQVKSLVIEGKVNIRDKVKQGKEAGKDSLALAKSKKWFNVYLFLFTQMFVHYESSSVKAMVEQHAAVFRLLDSETIDEWTAYCDAQLQRTWTPIILSLKLAWLFKEVAAVDLIHSSKYIQISAVYLEKAKETFKVVPSAKLQGWILEEYDRLGQRAMQIGLDAGDACIEFVALPTVGRIMGSWWNREDFTDAKRLWRRPFSWFRSGPFKLWQDRIAYLFMMAIFLSVMTEYNMLMTASQRASGFCMLAQSATFCQPDATTE